MILKTIDDQTIVKGLQNNNIDIINHIYKEYYCIVERTIKANKGSSEEARDIFQEALYVIYRKLVNKNLSIQQSFKAYFLAICRNMWYMELRKKKRALINNEKSNELFPGEQIDGIRELKNYEKRFKLLLECLSKLDSTCQMLCNLRLNGKSYKQIVARLNLISEENARKKWNRCFQKLVKMVKSQKGYEEIFEHEDI